ncbi:MAG: RDD family protein [Proteobacteria bacterium]|nr:RDD family protein [Pseudomonadota bacterium]
MTASADDSETPNPANAAAPTATPAHLGWRLLALVYDLLPLVAIWFVASLLDYLLRGRHESAPGSAGAWLMLALLWLVTGAYFVLSWRRGGHTLGMRAWRLKVLANDGRIATAGALWLRYASTTVPFFLLGAGWALHVDVRVVVPVCALAGLADFFWSLIDRDRRALHDLVAGTRFVRMDRAD